MEAMTTKKKPVKKPAKKTNPEEVDKALKTLLPTFVRNPDDPRFVGYWPGTTKNGGHPDIFVYGCNEVRRFSSKEVNYAASSLEEWLTWDVDCLYAFESLSDSEIYEALTALDKRLTDLEKFGFITQLVVVGMTKSSDPDPIAFGIIASPTVKEDIMKKAGKGAFQHVLHLYKESIDRAESRKEAEESHDLAMLNKLLEKYKDRIDIGTAIRVK